jgi:hypothetical protein
MKRFWLPLCLFPVLLLPARGQVGLTAIMQKNHMSVAEAAAVVVIADALHLNADFIISTGRGAGVSPVVYGPAFIYSYRVHRPFPEVWEERGRGWGEIAHSIGMHPGTFNKLRKQGYSVDQIIWMNTVNRRYGIPYTDYGAWRKRGMSDGRILEVVARNGGNRTRIASSMGGGPGKGKGHGNSQGQGKGKGHGAGHGKGHGGPPMGQGHGHGNGGGNGHGHGNGGGNGHGHGNGGGNGHGHGHGGGD